MRDGGRGVSIATFCPLKHPLWIVKLSYHFDAS